MNRRGFLGMSGAVAAALVNDEPAMAGAPKVPMPAPGTPDVNSIQAAIDVIDAHTLSLGDLRALLNNQLTLHKCASIPFDVRDKAEREVVAGPVCMMAGGITRDTFFDGLKEMPDTDFVMCNARTKVEFAKIINIGPVGLSSMFAVFGVPCFVSAQVKDDTIRFVRSEPFKVIEVQYC